MSPFRRLIAAFAVGILTMAMVSPAAAAPRPEPRPIAPEPLPKEIPAPVTPVYGISVSPTVLARPVLEGELTCSSHILIGNFTDADQDDDTLKVVGSVHGRGDVDYPAVRLFGTFMVYIPQPSGHLVTLAVVDDDGNRNSHQAVIMRPSGGCDPSPYRRR